MKLQLLNVVRETQNAREIDKLKAQGYKEITEEVANEKQVKASNSKQNNK